MIKTTLVYLIMDFCIDKIDEIIRLNMLPPDIRKRKLNIQRYTLAKKWGIVLEDDLLDTLDFENALQIEACGDTKQALQQVLECRKSFKKQIIKG